MKTSIVCKLVALLVILAIGILSPLQAQKPEVRFQQGLIKEEGEGSLLEAIDIFNMVVNDEAAGRPLQANSLLHIALCYEKLGRQEAHKTYRNIINNYPDQAETVKVAKEKLSMLSQTATLKPEKSKEFNIRKIWEGPEDLMGNTSPDGKYISYVNWETGDLALYELATGKTIQLTNKGSWEECQEYAEDSRWSPDGKQIVYTWWNEMETYDLRVIGIDGSGSRVLFSDEEVNYLLPCDWSLDGKQILACAYFPDNEDQAACLINVEDGSLRSIKSFKEWPGRMRFTRDGRHIIYDHQQNEKSSVRDIYLLPVDGGKEIPLVQHPSDDFFLGLAPDGKNVLFSSDRDGTLGFYILEIEDAASKGEPLLIKSGMGSIEVLGFTPEGSFYYGLEKELSDIHTAELDPISGSILTPLTKLQTRFQGNNKEPDYSPDGKYLAYISVLKPSVSNLSFGSGGGNVLMIRNTETQEERKIVPDVSRMGFPRWTRDGQNIVIVEWSEVNAMKYLQIDPSTGDMKNLLSPDEEFRLFGNHEWSPDGNTFYYGRFSKNFQTCQIRSRDIESGEERMIFESKNILHLSLSPDGRWLAVIERPRSIPTKKMFIIPASGGEARELFRIEDEDNIRIALSGSCSWSADGNYILFVLKDEKVEDSYWELCRIAAEGGEIEWLGIKAPGSTANLSMHPDGRHVAFSSISRPVKPAVWVMENFLPSD